MAKAKGQSIDDAAAEYDVTIPRPIPETLDAWIAFHKVFDCRYVSMGGLSLPCWGDIAARLSVWGLWTPELEEQLAFCFRELLKIEAENRKQAKDVGHGRN